MFGMKRSLIAVEVSAACYDEIVLATANAGAVVAQVDGAIDMRGVGLVRGPDAEVVAPRHRPISAPAEGMVAHHPINQKDPTIYPSKPPKKNTAPGAI